MKMENRFQMKEDWEWFLKTNEGNRWLVKNYWENVKRKERIEEIEMELNAFKDTYHSDRKLEFLSFLVNKIFDGGLEEFVKRYEADNGRIPEGIRRIGGFEDL